MEIALQMIGSFANLLRGSGGDWHLTWGHQMRVNSRRLDVSIHALESRRMFSVTSAQLVGPLTPGDQFKYQHIESGQFETDTTIGPTTFDNRAVIEQQQYVVDTDTGPVNGYVRGFQAFDKNGQWIDYGSQEIDGKGKVALTTTIDTGNVEYPPVLAAGKTYTFQWSAGDTVSPNANVPDPGLEITYSVTLTSAKLQSVTVPAGTFNAYVLNEVRQYKYALPGANLTEHTQLWIVPDLGSVKSINTVDGQKDVDTAVLLSHKIVPVTPPPPVQQDFLTLSATGTLTANGSSNADNFSITRNKKGRIIVESNLGTQTFAKGTVKRLSITLNGGNDKLSIGPGVPNATVAGGNGNDTIHGGDGDDYLIGGAGSDRLYGGAGNDTISGGGGKDRLYGEAGSNQLFGGAGNDKLYAANLTPDIVGGGPGKDSASYDAKEDVVTSVEGVFA